MMGMDWESERAMDETRVARDGERGPVRLPEPMENEIEKEDARLLREHGYVARSEEELYGVVGSPEKNRECVSAEVEAPYGGVPMGAEGVGASPVGGVYEMVRETFISEESWEMMSAEQKVKYVETQREVGKRYALRGHSEITEMIERHLADFIQMTPVLETNAAFKASVQREVHENAKMQNERRVPRMETPFDVLKPEWMSPGEWKGLGAFEKGRASTCRNVREWEQEMRRMAAEVGSVPVLVRPKDYDPELWDALTPEGRQDVWDNIRKQQQAKLDASRGTEQNMRPDRFPKEMWDELLPRDKKLVVNAANTEQQAAVEAEKKSRVVGLPPVNFIPDGTGGWVQREAEEKSAGAVAGCGAFIPDPGNLADMYSSPVAPIPAGPRQPFSAPSGAYTPDETNDAPGFGGLGGLMGSGAFIPAAEDAKAIDGVTVMSGDEMVGKLPPFHPWPWWMETHDKPADIPQDVWDDAPREWKAAHGIPKAKTNPSFQQKQQDGAFQNRIPRSQLSPNLRRIMGLVTQPDDAIEKANELHKTTDSYVWARVFLDTWAKHGPLDEDTVMGWFANAMCTAEDAARRRWDQTRNADKAAWMAERHVQDKRLKAIERETRWATIKTWFWGLVTPKAVTFICPCGAGEVFTGKQKQGWATIHTCRDCRSVWRFKWNGTSYDVRQVNLHNADTV